VQDFTTEILVARSCIEANFSYAAWVIAWRRMEGHGQSIGEMPGQWRAGFSDRKFEMQVPRTAITESETCSLSADGIRHPLEGQRCTTPRVG